MIDRITITVANAFVFTAKLLTDRAPNTCAAFTALLPYRQHLIHARWSGEACWIPLGDYQLGVGYENHTSHPSRGDLLWYPGGISETELLFAYGSSLFGSKVGQLAGNHFLAIVGAANDWRRWGATSYITARRTSCSKRREIVSILTGLVRRGSEATKGAATDTNRIQGETNAFHSHGHGDEGCALRRHACILSRAGRHCLGAGIAIRHLTYRRCRRADGGRCVAAPYNPLAAELAR